MNPLFRNIHSPSVIAVALAISLIGASGSSSAATVMTSITGNVSVAGEHLEQYDVVSASDRIETEGSATASLMIGSSALVTISDGASLGFASDRGAGPNVLKLRAGHLKVSTGQRTVDNALQIHTPAAIATLLGSQVHVAVNPDNGDTVITSIAHRIRVTGIGDVGGSASDAVVLSPGQQVTIRKGAKPGAVELADLASFENTSDSLNAGRFRVAAVRAARFGYAASSLAPIALMDDPGPEVPIVAAGPPLIPTGTLGPATTIQPCLSAAQCAAPPPGASPVFILSSGTIVGPQPPNFAPPIGVPSSDTIVGPGGPPGAGS